MSLPPLYVWDKNVAVLRSLPNGATIIRPHDLSLIRNCIEVWNLLTINSWKDWESTELHLMSDDIASVTIKHDSVKGGLWKDDKPVLWLPNIAQLIKNYGAAASFRHSIAAVSFLDGDEKRDTLQIIGAVFCMLNPILRKALEGLIDTADDRALKIVGFFNYLRNSLVLALDFADPEIRAEMDATGRSPVGSRAHIYMNDDQLHQIFYNYFVSGNLYLEAINRPTASS